MTDRQIEWLRSDPWTVKDMDMARSIIARLEAADRMRDAADNATSNPGDVSAEKLDEAIAAYDAAKEGADG